MKCSDKAAERMCGLPSPGWRGWRRIASWGVFIAALAVYCLTLEWGASYWDCPEYIVTAWRLEPGHPPGNPLWTLTARMFTILGVTASNAAVAVNLSSALFMAAGGGLLASSLFIILRLTLFRSIRFRRLPAVTALLSASGALCFSWADSPWFSAVEAEVYAMSLFLTALTFRLAIGWSLMRDREAARRRMMLIVYLTGLSIGVHQLNLLAIPAVALIWYFRRVRRRSAWRTAAVLVCSFAAVGVILLGMMPGVIGFAEVCEWWCVNDLGLPLHSGVWLCWGVLIAVAAALPVALRYLFVRLRPSRLPGMRLRSDLLMLAWMPLMLLIGYSAYFIILTRGAANPPMNEGAPSDIFALASYLGRDQYGTKPLFYGRTPYSKPLREEVADGSGGVTYPRFARRPGRARITLDTVPGRTAYVKYGERFEFIYPPEQNMLLPRMTSGNPDDIASYGDWAGMRPGTMDSVEVSYAVDSAGRAVGKLGPDGRRVKEKGLRPTYLQQLRYLGGYQVSYMYLRYLLWNFSGRQNDRSSVGEVEHGNFITGIAPIDDAMLGPQSALPKEIGEDNAGRNVYFMVPLILGVIGILMLSDKRDIASQRWNFVIFMLFFMTGVAIVLYLNQNPREPRERDYSFLGSFWAYALWIGAGMAALWRMAYTAKSAKVRRILAPVVLLISAVTPVWMLAENYDDHDRSGRTAVEAYAGNLLRSLDRDAILFVNGDNYTFPLWYAQEVLGLRRDVTVINTAYLTTPWYVVQMMRPGEESLPVRMQVRPEQLAFGRFGYVLYHPTPVPGDSVAPLDAAEALRRLYADSAERPKLYPLLSIPSDDGSGDIVLTAAEVAGSQGHIGLASLVTLDIVATNAALPDPRPVYWIDMLPGGAYAGLRPYTVHDLQSRRLRLSNGDAPGETPRELHMESGGADCKGFYADVTTGSMISRQRMSMVRYAGRLLDSGYAREALDVARESERLFPPEVWEYQIVYDSDSVHHEGFELAGLKIRAGRLTGDSAAVAEGERLLQRERERYGEWRRYRGELPRRLRNVMTPKNLKKAICQ